MSGTFYPDHFLIAEPELEDPNFRKSVVLLLVHNEQGAFGLVLNRQTDFTLGDLSPDHRETRAGGIKVHWGGPVENQALFFLRESESPPGYEWSPLTEANLQYLNEEWGRIPAPQRPSVRIFSGYSGWGPNQLETEMRFRSWKVLPADQNVIFYTKPTVMWNTVIERFGGVYLVAARFGFKPSLN